LVRPNLRNGLCCHRWRAVSRRLSQQWKLCWHNLRLLWHRILWNQLPDTGYVSLRPLLHPSHLTASAVCDPPCANGSCDAPDSCNCAGTGYTDSTCSTPGMSLVSAQSHSHCTVCTQSCSNGGVCSAPDTCNCTGTGYTGEFCDDGMFALCSQTRFSDSGR
jgi:hypothetical protein